MEVLAELAGRLSQQTTICFSELHVKPTKPRHYARTARPRRFCCRKRAWISQWLGHKKHFAQFLAKQASCFGAYFLIDSCHFESSGRRETLQFASEECGDWICWGCWKAKLTTIGQKIFPFRGTFFIPLENVTMTQNVATFFPLENESTRKIVYFLSVSL